MTTKKTNYNIIILYYENNAKVPIELIVFVAKTKIIMKTGEARRVNCVFLCDQFFLLCLICFNLLSTYVFYQIDLHKCASIIL